MIYKKNKYIILMYKKYISSLSLVTSIVGLCYQINILNPWHQKLSNQYDEIKSQNEKIILLLKK
jgi:hypothetical protein